MAHREMRSLQASVGANVTSADAKGIQGTVGVNVAKSIHGAQVSVGANVAPGDSEGLQATVGINVAGDMKGLQSGSVNVAKDMDGIQVGFVNAGRKVKGAQIGLVNVADDVDGLAIGLLTLERKGRHDLLAYASESDLFNAEFKLGGDYFHTVFGVGGVPGRHAWYGLGWGAHLPAGNTFWLDLDGIWQAYLPVADITQLVDGELVQFDAFDVRSTTSVVRTRLTLGAQLAKQLAVFGGVSMAVRLPINTDNRLDIAPGYAFAEDQEIRAWPGAVVVSSSRGVGASASPPKVATLAEARSRAPERCRGFLLVGPDPRDRGCRARRLGRTRGRRATGTGSTGRGPRSRSAPCSRPSCT